MRQAYRTGLLLTASTMVWAAAASSASAQTTDSAPATDKASTDQIQDIVVTAQKRSERLQNVPIAVTALSGDDIAAKGLSNTQEIAAATPGLNFTTVIGTSVPRIRGIGTAAAIAGNENSVATYVDGVYIASSASSILSLSNVAQVAVLKGPQGTLFGRNATGGLLQVTTLDPKHDFQGRASFTYGNEDTVGGSFYVTGGIAPRIAADLSVYYNNQQDGFGRNLTTGRDVNKVRNLVIRSKWLIDLDDSTTATIVGDYATTDGDIPRRPTYDTSPPGGKFTGSGFDTGSNVDSLFANRQGGGSLDLVHRFDGFSVSNLVAYRSAHTHVRFDIDSSRVALTASDLELKDWQFSDELQITSNGTGPFSWTAGAFYFRGKGGYDPAIVDLPTLVQTFNSDQRTGRMPAMRKAHISSVRRRR